MRRHRKPSLAHHVPLTGPPQQSCEQFYWNSPLPKSFCGESAHRSGFSSLDKDFPTCCHPLDWPAKDPIHCRDKVQATRSCKLFDPAPLVCVAPWRRVISARGSSAGIGAHRSKLSRAYGPLLSAQVTHPGSSTARDHSANEKQPRERREEGGTGRPPRTSQRKPRDTPRSDSPGSVAKPTSDDNVFRCLRRGTEPSRPRDWRDQRTTVFSLNIEARNPS